MESTPYVETSHMSLRSSTSSQAWSLNKKFQSLLASGPRKCSRLKKKEKIEVRVLTQEMDAASLPYPLSETDAKSSLPRETNLTV